MALQVKYKYSELVTFASSSNAEQVILPQIINPDKTLVFTMSNNSGNTSTGGSSLGNVMITSAPNAGGTLINCTRNYNFQQAVECRVVIFEFTASSGIVIDRGETALNSGSGYNDALLSQPWISGKTVPFIQARGNPSFGSDMRDYTVLGQESVDDSNYLRMFHGTISSSWICSWQVAHITDVDLVIDDLTEASAIVNGTRFLTVPTQILNRTFTTMSLYGQNTGGTASVRDMPMGSLSNTTIFLYECGSFSTNDFWFTQLYLGLVSTETSVQRQVVNLSSKTNTYTLATSVPIDTTIERIIGQFDSWGAPDSYEEQTGDFMIRVDLIDRGDGIADEYSLTRGVSTSEPAAKVSVEFITFTATGDQSIIINEMHKLKMKNLNNQ